MGALEQAIEQAIKKQVGNLHIGQILTGVARKVTNTTCMVERDNAPELHGVRLNAIDDSLQSFITVVPVDGSNVIVGIIENMKTEAVVLRCSEVEKVILKIGNQALSVNKDGFVFNKGENALLKLNEVVTWMGKVYDDLQTLKTQLSTHPTTGEGAPLGLTFNVTTPQPKAATFEDKNIKH
jgi:hypothetical protein